MNRERLAAAMRRHNVDALVATSPENIFYASGHMPFQGVWNRFTKAAAYFRDTDRIALLLPIAEGGFLADSTAQSRCEIHLYGKSNTIIPDDRSGLDEAESRLAEWTGATAAGVVDLIVGLCRDLLPTRARVAVDRTGGPELFGALQSTGEPLEWLDRGEDVWRFARMVKMPAEIDRLKAAIDLNETAIAAVLANLNEVDERQLERIYRAAAAAGGGAMQHYVGNFGRRAGSYRTPGDNRALHGDRFRIDAGLELAGYCSDLGCTARVGEEPSRAERATYEALTAGIDEGIAAARPGIRASELYGRVIRAIRLAGLTDHQFSLAGHGIGVEPRDYPIIAPPTRPGSPFLDEVFDPELEEGMVLNIECPLNELAKGAYQHEVTLLVERDGARLLSQRRELLAA